MATSKFRWTEHLIDCDRQYDRYLKSIVQGDNRDVYISCLKSAADKASVKDLSGYAAYMLYDLYETGEYVAQDHELAMKYLELGCNLGEAECLMIRASRDSTSGEELDKKLEEIINNGCNREYEMWEMRAILRDRKNKKFMAPNVTPLKPSYLLRLKYMLKAKSSLPKNKYFDSIRRRYKKQISRLMVLPIVIVVLAVFIGIFAYIA